MKMSSTLLVLVALALPRLAWAEDIGKRAQSSDEQDEEGWAPEAPAVPPPAPLRETPARDPDSKPERHADNAIYVEFLDGTLLPSVNYDRILGDFALRAGVGFSNADSSGSRKVVLVPVSASWFASRWRNNIFEVGGGALFNTSSGESAGNVFFGYRWQQPHRAGPMFRLGVNVWIQPSPSSAWAGPPILPLPYAALGFAA